MCKIWSSVFKTGPSSCLPCCVCWSSKLKGCQWCVRPGWGRPEMVTAARGERRYNFQGGLLLSSEYAVRVWKGSDSHPAGESRVGDDTFGWNDSWNLNWNVIVQLAGRMATLQPQTTGRTATSFQFRGRRHAVFWSRAFKHSARGWLSSRRTTHCKRMHIWQDRPVQWATPTSSRTGSDEGGRTVCQSWRSCTAEEGQVLLLWRQTAGGSRALLKWLTGQGIFTNSTEKRHMLVPVCVCMHHSDVWRLLGWLLMLTNSNRESGCNSRSINPFTCWNWTAILNLSARKWISSDWDNSNMSFLTCF